MDNKNGQTRPIGLVNDPQSQTKAKTGTNQLVSQNRPVNSIVDSGLGQAWFDSHWPQNVL